MFLHLGGLFLDEGLFASRDGTDEEEGTGDEVRLGAEGGTIRIAADGRGGTNVVDMDVHEPYNPWGMGIMLLLICYYLCH